MSIFNPNPSIPVIESVVPSDLLCFVPKQKLHLQEQIRVFDDQTLSCESDEAKIFVEPSNVDLR